MRKTSWIVTRAAAATVVAAWGTHAAAQSIVDKAALLDGNWSTQDIWDDVGFPPPREPDNTAVGDGEAYNAIIAAPGGRTVTITDAGENAIRVDAGTGSDGSSGTLVMTGGTLTISNPDPIAGGLPSLRVGVTPGSSGLFTMSGGTVSILGAPNSGFADGDFMVGDQGIGVANLSGGTVTASDEVLIGVFGTGTVTVSGTATLANNVAAGSVARGIIVGTESGSNGRLNIRDSATVTTRTNLDIGRRRNNVTNVRSTGFIDMTGGTINVGTPTTAGADFTVGFESDGRFDVSGASVVNIVDNLVLGIIASTVPSPAASGIVNHGGTATVNVDEILVGENGIGTYNMTGGTINGRNTLHVALNGVSTGTFNQSAGTITVPRLDAGERGAGTYNMNGGTLNVATTAAGNLRIGQDGGGANVGVGTFNHTAGTVSVGSGALASHIFLGDFDDSTGTYKISGGVLNVSGNVNVGAALASNAAPDATRTGTGGQALNAVGTFIVSGSAGDINVAGDFLANAGDKNRPGTPNQSHLGFEIFDATGTSLIEVASAADLDGAVVNMSLMGGYTPAPDTVFNLLSAGVGIGGDTGTGTTKINGSTGEAFSLAAGDATDWTLRVVPGLLAGSEFLQAVFQLTNVPRTLYWDVDGTTPGGGGATPAGDWNGSTANFNTDATGGAGGTATGATTDLDTVVFAAGADGGGTYAVNLTGTRTAAEVQVARGNVTLAGGTLATGSFDVAAGASGTVSSLVSGNAAGAVTKKGAGVLTLAANNTYTGGTNVQAGTLRVTRLHENNPVNITGGKLQVMDSSPTLPSHPSGDNAFVSRPSSLTIANNGAPLGTRTYAGQLDLGNNDLIIDYSGATPFADIQDMIRAGYNGGTWLGNGIASSTAAANSNFALGIAENSQLTIPFSASRLFSGQVVDTTTILVKFTHRIDLDLDGVITTNDATIFNSRYSEGAPAYWSIGDLDYDKVFTTNDATLFNSFYNEALASVPEPATLGVLGVGALGLLRRQRRGA